MPSTMPAAVPISRPRARELFQISREADNIVRRGDARFFASANRQRRGEKVENG
jgi:hypothetical protein